MRVSDIWLFERSCRLSSECNNFLVALQPSHVPSPMRMWWGKSELVRATLIMFREYNTLEFTFCVEFLIILLRDTLTNSLALMTLMTQAW